MRIERHAEVVPGLYFSWDSDEGQVELDLADEPGALLALQAQVTGAPRWLSMSVVLGEVRLEPAQALGLAAAGWADGPRDILPFLRSRRGDTMGDTHFAEPLRFSDRLGHVAALKGLAAGDAATGAELFHTLILPLPQESFRLVLADLRLFVLHRDPGAALDETLGGLAA